MKLRKLIERLEEIEQDLIVGLGEDVQPVVVAATQPNWPLAGSILDARVLDDDGEPVLIVKGEPIVWLAIGAHPDNLSPCASCRVFEDGVS